MKVGSETKLYKAGRTGVSQNQGKFRIYFNLPGCTPPDHAGRDYDPLTVIVRSFMDPDTHITIHPHRNEEIIS